MGETPARPAVVEVDIQYGEAGGRPLLLDIVRPRDRPAAPAPVVVYIHGGGWMGGSKGPGRNRFLAERGFFTVSIAYRLSQEAIFPAQLEDAKAAIRWLRAVADRRGLDPERIGVWGHSAGGHLAALLGVTGDLPALEGASGSPSYSSRVGAVGVLSGPTGFLQMGGWHEAPDSPEARLVGGPIRERLDVVRAANPISYVPTAGAGGLPPFLIVHGEGDEAVPLGQGRLLHEALTGAGADATFVPLPGVGHDFGALVGPDGPDLSPTRRLLLNFFDRHLRGGAGAG